MSSEAEGPDSSVGGKSECFIEDRKLDPNFSSKTLFCSELCTLPFTLSNPDSMVLDVDKVNPVDILTSFFQGVVYHLWSMTEDSFPRESKWKVKAVFNASSFVKFEPSEYDLFGDDDVEPGDVFFGISQEYYECLIQMAQSAAVALYPLKGGLIKDEIWEAWNVVGMLGRDLMTEKIASVDFEDYLVSGLVSELDSRFLAL